MNITTIVSNTTFLIHHGDDATSIRGGWPSRGYVVSDGWDETHFIRGATITISMDGPRLHLLTFRERIVDKLAHWLEG